MRSITLLPPLTKTAFGIDAALPISPALAVHDFKKKLLLLLLPPTTLFLSSFARRMAEVPGARTSRYQFLVRQASARPRRSRALRRPAAPSEIVAPRRLHARPAPTSTPQTPPRPRRFPRALSAPAATRAAEGSTLLPYALLGQLKTRSSAETARVAAIGMRCALGMEPVIGVWRRGSTS